MCQGACGLWLAACLWTQNRLTLTIEVTKYSSFDQFMEQHVTHPLELLPALEEIRSLFVAPNWLDTDKNV